MNHYIKNILVATIFIFCFAWIPNITTAQTSIFCQTNLQVQNGQGITVPIQVLNFTNVAAIQFTVYYDNTVLQYVSGNTLIPAFVSNINNTVPGIVTYTWSSLLGATVPDNSALLELNFIGIGVAGTQSTINFVDDSGPNGIVFDIVYTTGQQGTLTSQDGVVTIVSSNQGGGNTPVPTLSEWGLILLILLLSSYGLIVVGQKETSFANGANMPIANNSLPFDLSYFIIGLKWSTAIAIIGFAISLALTGTITQVDFLGTIVCLPVLAYLIHLYTYISK